MQLFLDPLAPESPGTAVAAVDWWARGFALAGILLALAGMVLSIRTYWRAGAWVVPVSPGGRVRWHEIFRIGAGIWLPIMVRNRGLAPMEIEHARWEVDGLRNAAWLTEGWARLPGQKIELDAQNRPVKPASFFPMTVPGQHAGRWSAQPPVLLVAEGHLPAYRMRLVVRFGTGKVVKSRWIIVNDTVEWDYIERLAGWRKWSWRLSDWRAARARRKHVQSAELPPQ